MLHSKETAVYWTQLHLFCCPDRQRLHTGSDFVREYATGASLRQTLEDVEFDLYSLFRISRSVIERASLQNL